MMEHKPDIERRAFIRNAGAALSATVAGSAAAAALPSDTPALSPAHPLEDVEAIRKLHYTLVERLNGAQFAQLAELFAQDAEVPLWVGASGGAGSVKTYFLGDAQHADQVDVAPGRLCATGKFHCLVWTQTAIDSPLMSLAEMATLQGGAASQRWERGVVEAGFSRIDDRWRISRLVYRAQTTTSTLQPNIPEA